MSRNSSGDPFEDLEGNHLLEETLGDFPVEGDRFKLTMGNPSMEVEVREPLGDQEEENFVTEDSELEFNWENH